MPFPLYYTRTYTHVPFVLRLFWCGLRSTVHAARVSYTTPGSTHRIPFDLRFHVHLSHRAARFIALPYTALRWLPLHTRYHAPPTPSFYRLHSFTYITVPRYDCGCCHRYVRLPGFLLPAVLDFCLRLRTTPRLVTGSGSPYGLHGCLIHVRYGYAATTTPTAVYRA